MALPIPRALPVTIAVRWGDDMVGKTRGRREALILVLVLCCFERKEMERRLLEDLMESDSESYLLYDLPASPLMIGSRARDAQTPLRRRCGVLFERRELGSGEAVWSCRCGRFPR